MELLEQSGAMGARNISEIFLRVLKAVLGARRGNPWTLPPIFAPPPPPHPAIFVLDWMCKGPYTPEPDPEPEPKTGNRTPESPSRVPVRDPLSRNR